MAPLHYAGMQAGKGLTFWMMAAVVPTLTGLAAVRAHRDTVYDAVIPQPKVAAAVAPPAMIASSEGTAGRIFRRAEDGLFYVKAQINGRTLNLLVDTGASIVVLTSADAAAIGLNFGAQHYNASVDTVGGSTAMAMTTLGSVNVAGHEVKQVQAAVVRGGLGVSLLGQNALSRLGSVTISGDQLIFH